MRVQAEPGQSVRAGQVLVIVDSPQIAELRGQLVEARARLKLAEQQLARTAKNENRAAVIQAKNKLDLAESTLERKRRLASLGATAGREVAEAETEYKNAKAEFDYQSSIQIAREQQEAENEVEKARANITRLTQSLTALGASTDGQGGTINITSPIAGVVVDRNISVGETITSDKELMTVMNLSSVVIEAQMPESQTRRVQIGQRIVARIPGYSDGIIEGKVQSIGSMVDPEKRTIAVRALVANSNAILKHEMAVEVRVTIGEPKEALVVPSSALVDEEGMKIVYVKEGERYERRPVTVGTINYRLAEILSGIEEGEEVVTAGAYQLANMRKGGSEEGEDHDEH
jgi:cobalt-zinc-cadmium efflux system membrane fusion protein